MARMQTQGKKMTKTKNMGCVHSISQTILKCPKSSTKKNMYKKCTLKYVAIIPECEVPFIEVNNKKNILIRHTLNSSTHDHISKQIKN